MADIYVEVRARRPTSGDLSPRPGVPELLANRIDEVADGLRDIAIRMAARFGEFAVNAANGWQLSDMELKFSLDLEAEAGVIIARTTASAGFEATLTWSKRIGQETK
jgi:hypothetical protein